MSFFERFGALRRLDWSLLAATILLAAFGLAALYSVTINVDQPDYGRLIRQAAFALFGIVCLVLLAASDYRIFKTYSWVLYGFGVVLLIVLYIFSEPIRGTRGWLVFFGQTFQPVEIVRIILVIALSRLLADRIGRWQPLKTIFLSAALAAIYVALVLIQPEFGYAVIMLMVWLGLLLFTRLPRWQIVLIILGIILIGIFSWFLILRDYQKDRILTFVGVNQDQQGARYNVTQSVVAIGSGRWFGRGLGLGPQSQLNFLPEQSTDFIFAVIAEELGYLGSMLVLGTFALLFYRIYRAIRLSRDVFTTLLLTGFLYLLFIQMFINIGMNLGLLPVTGVPLPFVSYGGSALVSNLIIIGIIESIIIRQPLTRP